MTRPPDEEASSFGEIIRRRRVELGLTQEALAERMGENVRQSDISRMERDYVMLPRRDRLEALAAALEVTPGYLLLHSGWITQEEMSLLEREEEQRSAPWDDPQPQVPGTAGPVDDGYMADAGATGDWGYDPVAMSTLSEAITRARGLAEQTDQILRRSSDAVNRARMRRPRPAPESPE